MPLYDFQCCACGLKFETLAKSDEKRAECPQCKTDQSVERFGVPMTAPHSWGCSSDGAMPRRGN